MNIKLFEQKNSQIESFEIITLHTSGMRYSADVEIVMKGDAAEVSQYQIRYRYPEDERILEKRVSVSCDTMLKLCLRRFLMRPAEGVVVCLALVLVNGGLLVMCVVFKVG